MLLSSTAEAMYWTGRYVQRAQALARAVMSYERLSLDLPEQRHSHGALLGLVGRSASAGAAPSSAEALGLLVLDAENPSSVRGALERARENLRSGRTILPPAVWTSVSALHARLGEVAPAAPAEILAALEAVDELLPRVEGELASGMTRDAAYSFWRIGCEVERADMLLRLLSALVPELAPDGSALFADVRLRGLLLCVDAYSMYRRRHQARAELPTVLAFVLAERAFPRSYAHALAAIEAELDRLPRPGAARSALSACAPDTRALVTNEVGAFLSGASTLLAAVARLSDAVTETYFPADRRGSSGTRAPCASRPNGDPFAQLGREHAAVEGVLRVVDELVANAECGLRVVRDDLLTILGFFTDFGVLGHHEKEEAILMPSLLVIGFDWNDGPLAAIRRDHRQEHYFLRVLTHLACQLDEWSEEDRRHFASTAREFTSFLRNHMRTEQRDVFEPASHRLSGESKAALSQALAQFDSEAGLDLGAARSRVDGLLAKYAVALPFSA